MNIRTHNRLLGLCILALGVHNITASSATTTTDNFTTVRRPTRVINPLPEHAAPGVMRYTRDNLRPTRVPKLYPEIRLTKKVLSDPTAMLKATIATELRGLIFIAERVDCTSDHFDCYPYSPHLNDMVLTDLLTNLTRKNAVDALDTVKSIIQEFGHIPVPSTRASIKKDLQDQCKRLSCMRQIIKILSDQAPNLTWDRYRRLYIEHKIDDKSNLYTEFNAVQDLYYTLKPIPTAQLQKNFKLFTNKAVALSTLKTAQERLANLL